MTTKRKHTHVESEAKNIIGDVEHRYGGVLVGVEGRDGADLIAAGILSGDFDETNIRDAKPADLILVPAPFVIECIEGGMACGDSPDMPLSRADAAAKGWTHVEFVPMAMGSSYYGLCPDCRKENPHA